METPSQPPPLVSPDTAAPVPLAYAAQPAAQYALYSPGAVGLATFLGAPLAGCAIMAMNYRRLGKPSSATKAVIIGVLVTAAMIVAALALPARTPGSLIPIISIVIMVQIAKALQGQVFESHKQAGGRVASMWGAAGIGLVSLILVLGIIFAGVFAMEPPSGKRLTVAGSEVIYSGSATQADAQALGDALTKVGYFGTGHKTSVLLVKDSSGTTIKFVVSEDAGQKDSTLAAFETIVDQIAPAIGGKPVTLKLVDPELTELKSKKME